MTKRKSGQKFQPKLIAKLILGGLVAALLIFVFMILMRQPSANRDWKIDVAVWPEVIIDGDQFTINNIRDWRYNHQTVVSTDYVNRTYQTSDLKQVWFLVEPFGSWDGIAHTFFSFEFHSAPPLVFSVEARMEEGEEYSALRGLFNEYELYYSWGTEEDHFTRRVISSGNELYLYPLQISEVGGQQLLQNLLIATQRLAEQPEFYNTLTSNCTNNLARYGNQIKSGLIPHFHYARYMTGYSDELLYKLGLIPRTFPFSEVMVKYRITDLVEEHQGFENFSDQIRESL